MTMNRGQEDRTILHCDLNGFYASVESLYKPELRQVPMAVAGNVENRHGIILAKNELAKAYGVTTAETVWQAKRKCPELVLVEPHHDRYAKYSKIVNKLYERFTDVIEPFGID
jgi:DNA polymerase IV